MFQYSRRLRVEPLEDRRLLSIAAIGDVFTANTQTSGNQVTFGQSRAAAVAADSDGDYVSVWSSEETSGSGYDVFGQLFDSTGVPVGSEFRVNETTAAEQKFPGVAMDDDGDFVVTWSSLWQDGNLYGRYVRRYDSAGTPLDGEFRVNDTTAGNQNFSAVAMDADGDFTIVWTSSDQDGDRTGVFARRYATDGTAISDEIGVNTTTAGNQRYPVIASDSVGGTVVAWTSDGQDGSNGGIFAQRLACDGTPIGSEFPINTTTVGNQQLPSVAVSPGGNFLIAWQGFDLTDGEWKAYVQGFDASGTAVGGETVAGSGRHVSAAMGVVGDFVVAWEAPSASDPSRKEIRIQHFDPLGAADGATMTYQAVDASLTAPSIAMQGDKAVVLWTATLSGGQGSDVHGQRVQPTLAGTFNESPIVSLPGNAIIDENQPIALSVSATDSDVPVQNLAYTLVGNPPTGATLDSATGQFAWMPDEAAGGQTFEIAVRVTDSGMPALSDQGTFLLTVNEVNEAPVLAAVDDQTLTETGTVSFTASATDVDLPVQTLTYSLDAGAPAGASIDPVTGEFTWTTTEADTPGVYSIAVRVTDDGPGTLDDTESFTITISVAHLYGEVGDDTIDFTAGELGGPWHSVTINGSTESYDPAVVDKFHIDGLDGDDSITIHGAAEDETVALHVGTVDVVGETYDFHGTSIEDITVGAGTGNDDVTMTGSPGSNRLYSYPDYARLSDSPRTFSHRVDGFDTVTVDAPGSGRDYAFIYDSPDNDVLDANPARVILNRAVGTADPTVTTTTGFQRAYLYANNGGTDTATLTGSDTTRNRFYGYADYSMLTESRRSFYFYARGFDTVTANSPGSGYTYAYLHDSSGLDALTASPTSTTMDRAAGWSDTTATGFKRVYAYSTRGGDDRAELTGSATGGNRYRGYPTYSTLTDTARSFYHYARGFRSVTATGSATDTSSDRAYLYDSNGADTLVGRGNSAILKDTAETTYQIEALYFDLVYARSSDGDTNDTVDVDDSLVYNLIRSGTW